MYPREQYLNKIISKKDNGRIKIITGLRRSGKSVLLFQLYRDWLIKEGIYEDHIIALALDVLENAKYRNPIELDKYVRDRMVADGEKYYILIDEIQFVSEIQNPYVDNPDARISFIDVVLGFLQMKNADVYVTGSNSRMLSSDILTQFRDRGDEIRVYPLSFAEFYREYKGDKRGAWQDYYTYGGMPFVTSLETQEEKSRYLKDLFDRTYIKDVLERHEIKNDAAVLSILLDILASGIGSLTNPTKLSNTFKSERQIAIGSETIEKYIGYFEEAFLIEKAVRYDIKGRKYIGTPAKYYYTEYSGACFIVPEYSLRVLLGLFGSSHCTREAVAFLYHMQQRQGDRLEQRPRGRSTFKAENHPPRVHKTLFFQMYFSDCVEEFLKERLFSLDGSFRIIGKAKMQIWY